MQPGSCPFLSCPLLSAPRAASFCERASCPFLSFPVLSASVRSCPLREPRAFASVRAVLSCPVRSCPLLSAPLLSAPVRSCPVLSSTAQVIALEVPAVARPARAPVRVSSRGQRVANPASVLSAQAPSKRQLATHTSDGPRRARSACTAWTGATARRGIPQSKCRLRSSARARARIPAAGDVALGCDPAPGPVCRQAWSKWC
jgi:hypothetical protein